MLWTLLPLGIHFPACHSKLPSEKYHDNRFKINNMMKNTFMQILAKLQCCILSCLQASGKTEVQRCTLPASSSRNLLQARCLCVQSALLMSTQHLGTNFELIRHFNRHINCKSNFQIYIYLQNLLQTTCSWKGCISFAQNWSRLQLEICL